MHTKRYALLLAAVLAFGSTACAQESTDATTEAATEAAADVAQNAAKADAIADRAAAQQEKGASALSDKWTDYELQINDDILKFPMMIPEFEALGWEASDDLIDLVDTDIHQRICDIPAQLRIIAGHLDIHDMCGVRILYGDERPELLVIEIQVELVNDAVQHCTALDDVRIVVGQRR